jgi:exopolyphosphatase/pppGpp-phosphohydrolase
MRVHCLCRYHKNEENSWRNPKIIKAFSTYEELQEHVKMEYPEFTWNERSQSWEHPDNGDVLYLYSDVISNLQKVTFCRKDDNGQLVKKEFTVMAEEYVMANMSKEEYIHQKLYN